MHDNHFSVSFDNCKQEINHIASVISDAKESGAKGVTLLLGAQYKHDLNTLNEFLTNLDIPISGAIFPEVIYQDNYYKDGALVIAWNYPIKVKTFLDISNPKSELYSDSKNEDKPEDVEGCLIFIDARTKSQETALDALYYRNVFDFQYAGAGAGYIEKGLTPCIFTNEGVVEDALQTVCLPFHQHNKVCHGWSILSGPHVVTSSKENCVTTIDYLPIKDQYIKFINETIDEDVSDLNIDELIERFPFGIYHYGEDVIVRDALRYKDSSIQFMGDVPEFSDIYILSGEPKSLLNYVEDNLDQFEIEGNPKNNLSIIFSCVGRRFHMGSDSNSEVAVLSKGLKPTKEIIGTSSLGEIATNQEGLLRLHSMSLVVSRLYQ